MTAPPIAFINARLVDPASHYDGPGALITSQGLIAEVTHEVGFADLPPDVRLVDCNGAMLAPGLVDLRVKTGEPGNEPKETLKSACLAAAAGGVTSIVVQPDTLPVADDPSVIDFVMRRARDIGLVHVYPAGAATKGCEGKRMAGELAPHTSMTFHQFAAFVIRKRIPVALFAAALAHVIETNQRPIRQRRINALLPIMRHPFRETFHRSLEFRCPRFQILFACERLGVLLGRGSIFALFGE